MAHCSNPAGASRPAQQNPGACRGLRAVRPLCCPSAAPGHALAVPSFQPLCPGLCARLLCPQNVSPVVPGLRTPSPARCELLSDSPANRASALPVALASSSGLSFPQPEHHLGLPGISAGKESPCNAGDPGSSPELERFPREGIGYPLQYSWTSLVAQTVKNPPAVRETWVRSLGREGPLEEGVATHSSVLTWRTPWTEEPGGCSPWGLRESDTPETCMLMFAFSLLRWTTLHGSRALLTAPAS